MAKKLVLQVPSNRNLDAYTVEIFQRRKDNLPPPPQMMEGLVSNNVLVKMWPEVLI